MIAQRENIQKQLLMTVGCVLLLVLALLSGCTSGKGGISSGLLPGESSGLVAKELVVGKLADSEGNPISNAVVEFYQDGMLIGDTVTDEDGYFAELIAPGIYQIQITHSDFPVLTQSFEVIAGESNTFNKQIFMGMGYLSGTVKDQNTGEAIASASVTIDSQTVKTNSVGFYQFTLATGTYTVQASKSGYSSRSNVVTVVSNTTKTQDFSLVPNGSTLSGLVSDTSGTPQKDVLLRAVPVSGEGDAVDTSTGTDGKYSLYLGAGSYTLTLTKSGFGQQQVTISVESNTPRVKDFVLGAAATIAGTVKLTTTQEALPNIFIEIYLNGSDSKGVATTTSSGEFAFENLSPGIYEIRLGRGSQLYGAATYTVQILSDGTLLPEEPQLYLAPKILSDTDDKIEVASGTIVDAYSGAPLQYVTCSLKGFGSTITDLNGKFEFKNLIPATYELTFSKPGWETLIVSFVVNATGTDPRITPDKLDFIMVQTQQSDVGAITGRFVNETTQAGVSGLIVRVYRQRAETRPITVQTGVDESGNPTYGVEDYTAWELKADSPLVSTKTAESGSGKIDMAGTFRIEHLLPTTEDEKYLVYVGNDSSFVTTQNGTLAADFSDPKQVWIVENPNNVNRRHSWSLVDVKENTTTYLQNFNLATATATP